MDGRCGRAARSHVWRALALALLTTVLPGVCDAHAEGLDSSSVSPVGAGPTNPAVGKPWHFRVGPFFEVGQSDRGVHLLAVRPLYSRIADDAGSESITDVVWPWSSWHRRDESFGWWALPAFGMDADVRDAKSRHSFWLLPVYAEGRTRGGDDFAALFPFGGNLRGFLLQDEVKFVFFPLYLSMRQGEQRTESWLWPIYLRETGPARDRVRVFPVYGVTTTATARSAFCFWPFWTDQVFNEPKRHGTAEMLFPLYGRIDTDHQRGWMALPPFFSRIQTDQQTQLRCPWPFYEVVEKPDGRKQAYWPVWSRASNSNETRHSAFWPIWWDSVSTFGSRRETHTSLVPFYYHTTAARLQDGQATTNLDYVRYWPFYSRYARPDGTRIRVPELTFMREGMGIERNWAPFWSWYVQAKQGRAAEHDVLWGLARWGRECDDTTYGQGGFLFSWSRPPQGRLNWDVLGGICGRAASGSETQYHWLWFGRSPVDSATREPSR